MAQRALEWESASDGEPEFLPPIVVPIAKNRLTRKVGVVKQFSPAKTYGLVAGPTGDALFSIDDVAVSDRARLGTGQAVTFEIFHGPDGQTARQIRIDATDLPPPPPGDFFSKGWR
jgi:cold shock CspA family protein